MEDDWDLYAVVRNCSSTTTGATSTSTAAKDGGGCQSLSNFEQDCNFNNNNDNDPVKPRLKSSMLGEDLHELWKPFSHKQQQIFPISPLSVLQDLSSDKIQQPPQQHHHHQEIMQFPPQKQQLFSIVNGSKPSATLHHPSSRSKKRKNHSKKVCHVAAESLSSDLWSWRKYGQKPIKGSPYPRGYYRCSTSKGCMARKQVERNRSDPGMFILTYTGDHNHPMPTHRNSLAGSTRHKPNPDDDPKILPAPAPENMESSREDFAGIEDDDDDDFFAGLEDCLSDNSWLNATNAASATTAVGGG